jgi:hypothetical protein
MDIEERRTRVGGLMGVAVGIDNVREVVALAQLSQRDATVSPINKSVQRQLSYPD